ncbi:hypothetical protein ACJ73_07216 [Blastomyces percursus]|uniref:Uncharacterized protein n=1 Tax=Blastomyces percursus TaxID=1658174 RepID=A0A1J9QZ01_9EURO|nr:hypothetical protein ACJ73_07216 [Blastomyces percursus]
MESMFEKAAKGVVGGGGPGGLGADAGLSSSQLKVPENGTPELGPIVNCDRVYWRKQTRADVRKVDKRTIHNNNNNNNNKGARGALVEQRS